MSETSGMAIRKLLLAVALIAACGSAGPHAVGAELPARDRARSLIENLRAADVDVRRKAAADIQSADRASKRQALPVLTELLANEKDGQVRLAVLDTLASLGHEASGAVSALVQTLKSDVGGQGSEASHQDYRAALALAAIGKESVPGLRSLLKERKPNVRAEAAMALGRIGPDASAAVPDLIPLLGDKNERVRPEVSRSLGQIGRSAIGPLTAASNHGDAVVRAGATEGLGYVAEPDESFRAVVLLRTHDESSLVRAAAMRALDRLRLPDDVVFPVLALNLRDEDDQVRQAVVSALIARRSILARMAPELESLLWAQNERVARHAAYLLGVSGAVGVPRLLHALHDEKCRVDQIAAALAQVGRPATPLLTEALTSADSRVRRGAALALGQIRPLAPGTVPKLTTALSDHDLAVKVAVLSGIGSLGSRAREAVPAVRGLLTHESAEIRSQAIRILSVAAPRDEQLVQELILLVNDRDVRVQHQAIDILRSVGPVGRPALAAVIGRLSSTDPDVRIAAAEMVGSHGQAAVAALPALIALLDDPSPKIRTVAAATLGAMGKGAQPALGRLSSLLGAEQAQVREAATLTMAALELDADVVRPHLARALKDENADVRRAALKSIQRFGPQGAIFVPDIILMAENKDNLRSVERMLRRFERAGPDERSLPELVKQLDHKQPTVRRLATKFLGLAGPTAKDALPALERLRHDPSADVRKQAEAASEQIKKRSPSSL
jgi:HEAT repeat protein